MNPENATVDRGPQPGSPAMDGFSEISTGRIHFLHYSTDGPPVHFLHANGFCAGTYAPFFQKISPPLNLWASDVRGHGDSSGMPLPIIRWEPFAKDLCEFIGKNMAPPVVGMGHSLGAVVTYMAAAFRPELFSKIILMDPVIFRPSFLMFIRLAKLLRFPMKPPLAVKARRRKRVFSSLDQARERFDTGRGIFSSWQPEFIQSYLSCALQKDHKGASLKCDPETEAQIYESIAVNAWGYAKKIQCPALLVRGGRSDTFLEYAAARLNQKIAGAKLVTLEKSGHFLPMESGEELAKIILEFIKE